MENFWTNFLIFLFLGALAVVFLMAHDTAPIGYLILVIIVAGFLWCLDIPGIIQNLLHNYILDGSLGGISYPKEKREEGYWFKKTKVDKSYNPPAPRCWACDTNLTGKWTSFCNICGGRYCKRHALHGKDGEHAKPKPVRPWYFGGEEKQPGPVKLSDIDECSVCHAPLNTLSKQVCLKCINPFCPKHIHKHKCRARKSKDYGYYTKEYSDGTRVIHSDYKVPIKEE